MKQLAVLNDEQFEQISAEYLELLKVLSEGEKQPQYKGTDKDSMHNFVKMKINQDLLQIMML